MLNLREYHNAKLLLVFPSHPQVEFIGKEGLAVVLNTSANWQAVILATLCFLSSAGAGEYRWQ